MKYALFTFFSFLLVSSSNKTTISATENKPFAVLQLFTSQGCSSCPKADEFLEIVKKQYKKENVIVLSYHVDYWNYLGWKDPFSSKDFSNLQYKYANELRSKRVYTPQTVVNGKEHFVGSSKSKITKSITENLQEKSSNTVAFKNVLKLDDKINFEYLIDGKTDKKKLQIRLVLENKITNVKRGENRSRTISNSNIVIGMAEIDLNSLTKKGTIKIPNKYKNEKKLRLIGFVENENLHISGASQVKI